MGLNFDHPYVETGDQNSALQDWRLFGWTAENTDRGRLYVLLNGANLELYRSRSFGAGDLVATAVDAAEVDITFVESNSSGLSGQAFRHAGSIFTGTAGSGPQITLYVSLCSEQDLRELENRLDGLLIAGETNFSVILRQTMQEFLTRMAAVYVPPVSVANPERYAPSRLESGREGEQEWYSQFFWSLNRKGQWEVTGLQNPDDYRNWAVAQALAWTYRRVARAGDPSDPQFSRQVQYQNEANRLWEWIRPWVDCDRNSTPDRPPATTNTRLRRG